MKIFFMCTHPNQGTGYAKVANKLSNWLADQPNVEIVYYAFQNYPNQDIKDRYINPKIKFYDALLLDPYSPKGFGDKEIVNSFEIEKPDILFIYNDISVVNSIIPMMTKSQHKNYKTWVYLDLVYEWEHVSKFRNIESHIDHVFVFLDCWKRHMIEDIGWDVNKISTLPHGIDFDKLVHMDKKKSKTELGFKEDDFIVLNLNRNSYRKNWGTTLSVFFKFYLKMNKNDKIKLYCSCILNNEDGTDINETILDLCIIHDLDFNYITNNVIYINPKPLTSKDETINLIYNACDVGLNTCFGEGFGLVNLEHAYIGKPQIFTGVPAMEETLGTFSIKPKSKIFISNIEKHGGVLLIANDDDFVDALVNVYKNEVKINYKLEERFSWETVFKRLNIHILNGSL